MEPLEPMNDAESTRRLADHLAAVDSSEGDGFVRPIGASDPVDHAESLALRSLLQAEPKVELSPQAGQRGRGVLLAAVAERRIKGPQSMFERVSASLATRGVAAALGALLFVGGTMGASAALGGPNVPDQVVTLTQHALGINNAPDAAENGKAHANPKAFNGSENAADAAGEGSENANENAATGQQNAEDGAENATEGIGNANPAAENGMENAADQASEGSGNAGDNAPEVTTQGNPVDVEAPPVETPTAPASPEAPPSETPTVPSNPGDSYRP